MVRSPSAPPAAERPPTTPPTPSAEIGRELVAALVARDRERVAACFDPAARLRALVPSGFQEREGPADISARFVHWFRESAEIALVEEASHVVSDRLHLRWRFREAYRDGGSGLIEQDAYCDLREGRIVSIDLLCSGHRSAPAPFDGGVVRFDAGNLGCGSGLPEEFRRQIEIVPVGGTLEVATRDPSAKEDLPALARLLGHHVLSIESEAGGVTLLAVRRGR